MEVSTYVVPCGCGAEPANRIKSRSVLWLTFRFFLLLCTVNLFLRRLDVWNLIPGEGSAEVVKAMVKEKIQVGYMRDGAPVYVS